jgi:hypothetical protein
LPLRAARTQRCAGEGELVFGLTQHAVSLSGAMAGAPALVFGPLGKVSAGLQRPVLTCRAPPGSGSGPARPAGGRTPLVSRPRAGALGKSGELKVES